VGSDGQVGLGRRSERGSCVESIWEVGSQAEEEGGGKDKEEEEKERWFGQGWWTAVAQVLCAAPAIAVTILGIKANIGC